MPSLAFQCRVSHRIFLIFWADEHTTEDGLHADFKLSAGGESVLLPKADGTIVDSVNYPAQTANISYARNPNGTGNFVVQAPTFNANNQTLAVDAMIFENNQVAIFPNPTANNISLIGSATLGRIDIYNLIGQMIWSKNESSNQANISVAPFPAGTYLLKSTNDGKTAVSRFVKM